MWTPVEALSMKKSERKIIRLFSELSMKKRNRVIDVLNDMNDQEDVEQEKEEKELEEREDGTRGDCYPEPRVSKEQLDHELDEYVCDKDEFNKKFNDVTRRVYNDISTDSNSRNKKFNDVTRRVYNGCLEG